MTLPQLRLRSAGRSLTAALAVFAAVSHAPRPAAAQVPAPAPAALPGAEQIVARYHEAMGAATFANIRSLHSVGEVSIPVAGITGTLEIWQGRPNRTVMVASVPGYGEVRTGYNGENGWSVDPVEGPRILAGPEARQAEDDAHFDSHLRTAELIDSMTTIERTTLGGHDCFKVHTIWKTGRETSDCYSVESGLLIGSVRTHESSTGPTEALILYEDYQMFGAARLPTRITTQVDGVDQVVTLRRVTLNEVPDSAFNPPPEIRALLGG
ncbi:MAG TPA: hypothetical protein VK912_16635 [Longimicrobiales bacterium]|nr:hypothetical protein [Longimicrobiales bacterium]